MLRHGFDNDSVQMAHPLRLTALALLGVALFTVPARAQYYDDLERQMRELRQQQEENQQRLEWQFRRQREQQEEWRQQDELQRLIDEPSLRDRFSIRNGRRSD